MNQSKRQWANWFRREQTEIKCIEVMLDKADRAAFDTAAA